MMGVSSLSGAMQALRDDWRWQARLTEAERALCLRVAERRLADALEQAFTSVHGKLVSIEHILTRVGEDERSDVLRSLLE